MIGSPIGMDWIALRVRSTVTDERRAAFADTTVQAARAFEVLGIGVLVALMVLKPSR